MPVPRTLVCGLLLLLNVETLAAQDLSFITKIFSGVHSVNVTGQGGGLLGKNDKLSTRDWCGLCGTGLEVVFDVTPVTQETPVHLELGLGLNNITGLASPVDSFDLRGGFRANPSLTLQTWFDHGISHPVWERFVPYAGIQAGVVETVNLRAYNQTGQQYSLDGRTLEIGLNGGVYVGLFRQFGVFVEPALVRRHFASIDYKLKPNDITQVPPGWPRSFRANTWSVTVGMQFRIKDEAPVLAGTWLPAAVEGQQIPALHSQTFSGVGAALISRIDVVGGSLGLEIKERATGGRTRGRRVVDSTFTLTLLRRETKLAADGKTVISVEHLNDPAMVQSGSFAIQGNKLSLKVTSCPAPGADPHAIDCMPGAEYSGWISSSELRLQLGRSQRTVVFKRPG